VETEFGQDARDTMRAGMLALQNASRDARAPNGGFMRALFLTLILISNAGRYSHQSQPQTLQQPQSSPSPEAKQCKPDLIGFAIRAGFAYALKTPTLLSDSRPCPENSQIEQQNKQRENRPERSPNYFTELSAAEVMREARLLYIRPKSSWFNKEKLERELLKRKEFGELGLEITRSANLSDLVLEITRKSFTTRFTCSIIEPTTERVVAGTTASSLGGEIEPHLADAIVKQFREARKAAAEEKKPE